MFFRSPAGRRAIALVVLLTAVASLLPLLTRVVAAQGDYKTYLPVVVVPDVNQPPVDPTLDPGTIVPQEPPLATPTAGKTQAGPEQPGLTATNLPPLPTLIWPTATRQAPTATVIGSKPTRIPPTATVISWPTATKVPPTATRIAPTATRIAPTATKVPPTATRIAPTATKVPPTATRIAPTATKVPPTATKVPPTATKVPTQPAGGGQSPDSSPLNSPRPVMPTGGSVYYVSPSGSSSGDGSISRPWNIATALNHPSKVNPGDTIYLRGGKYGTGGSTKFTSRLTGTSSKPVILRGYPGERAIIDGGIQAQGAYSWFWGFEITNSYTNRSANATQRPPGLYMTGRGQKAINLAVYNTGHPGIGFWKEVGDGGEIYGCLIYGVGTYDTDRDGRLRGSAVYAQNETGTRYIRDVISFRNFTTGMKAYTEADYANGFHFEGNISFENGDRLIFVSGRDNPSRNLKLYNNYSYRSPAESDAPVRLGYADVDQYDATVIGNVFVNGTHTDGAFWMKRFRTVTLNNNLFVGPNMLTTFIRPSGSGTRTWDYNKYYDGGSKPFRLDTTTYNWADWKSRSGFDAHSTYSSSRPSGVNWFLRPNLYESNRANITVYNWGKASSVSLNLSSFLKAGDRYEIRDGQNYFGSPVVSGTYNGGAISVPMNTTAVASIPGTLPFKNVHTSPEFGVFVIVKLP